MKYYVRTSKDGRYIVWCDEHWYETSRTPDIAFTKAEADAIVKQLKNHYVYTATIEEAIDKTEETINK